MALRENEGLRRPPELNWAQFIDRVQASDQDTRGLSENPVGYKRLLEQQGVRVHEVQPQAVGGLEEFFAKLLIFWELSHAQGAALIGYGPQAGAKLSRILGGLATFDTPNERERILQLFEIRKLLGGLFRDRGRENRWLRAPNEGLDGLSPLNLLLTSSFSNLLKVRQFVEHLAGL